MDNSISKEQFLDAFSLVKEFPIDEHGKHKIALCVLHTNANEFDYSGLTERLLQPLADYTLSRYMKNEYYQSGNFMEMSKVVREKFKEYHGNTGELGEFMLYCFLETHLGAPKILSKLELKTSTSMYVHGSDGVHFLKLPNGDYQLIFGESKMIENPTDALRDAFNSINEFKKGIRSDGKKKSGLAYEKMLISSNLTKEVFTEDEISFIRKLLLPVKDNDFFVDNAFGIFIGYDLSIDISKKSLSSREFREWLNQELTGTITHQMENIKNYIKQHNLQGHDFYLYIVPFEKLDDSRKNILEGLLT